METEKAQKIADEILGMYESYGGDEYAGEKVTQLEHMAQAAELAKAQGFDNEVVLAAFLHDIGHIAEHENESNGMNGFGIMDHEALGADFLLERGFSEKVARLVKSHVAAKRYLTLRSPGYYDHLSDASKTTLTYQGGPMKDAEADEFEADPLFKEIVQMRLWDEEAKIENVPVPDLSEYHEMIVDHLKSR